MRKVKIGILGCGFIIDNYLQNFTTIYKNIEVAAVCDLIYERAVAIAEKYQLPIAAKSYADMLAMDEIEIILILTNPQSHASTAMQALEAGKHVYIEKPFAMNREEARAMMALAQKKGLRIGCAPDTHLAGGSQTVRKLVDDGWVGKPFAVFGAFCHQPQTWHKNAPFLFQAGAGPLYDGLSYYIADFVNIFGPVKSVYANLSIPEPIIKPRYGDPFPVEVPSYDTAILEFVNGMVCTIIFSFNVYDNKMPHFEVYGTEGTIHAPLPNAYGGKLEYKRMGMPVGEDHWMEIPNMLPYQELNHGLGVADMASAIVHGREHRTNAVFGYHVLDVLQAFEDASREARVIQIESTCERPEAVPLNLQLGEID